MTPGSKFGKSFNRWVYIVLSVLITAGVFGYLLTRVSPAEVVGLLRRANPAGLLMFLTLSLSMSVFRLMRYELVLRTAGYRPPRLPLFLIVLVRNFFSDLLPARLGTLVYVYLVTTRLGVPFGAAASSFAMAFLFDMIALAPLIAVAALFVGTGTGLSAPALVAGGLILLAGTLVVLGALPRLVRVGAWLVGRLRFLGEQRVGAWTQAVREAEADIVLARRLGVYIRLVVLSVLIRLAKYGSLYVFLHALVEPIGYGFAELHPPRVFLGLCASELAASLPVSGIAGFGVYEGAWALVFRLLGFPGEFADLTAVSHHLFTQVYGYSLGALALLVLLLPVFRYEPRRLSEEPRVSPPLRFYGAVLGFSLFVVLILCGIGSLAGGSLLE